MRFSFKQRPMFAALIVLVVLLAAPLAYAVVNRVFLHIDPDKSAPEIEKDLQRQLDKAGVQGADVEVGRQGDGRLTVKITGKSVGSDVEIVAPEIEGAESEQRTIRVAVGFPPTPAQQEKLTATMSLTDVRRCVDGELTGDELAATLKHKLADSGIDADVTVTGGAHISVTVKAIH